MEIITPALKIWRNAVVTSLSASQLAMCLFMLYDCVAWEKSIMKVVRGYLPTLILEAWMLFWHALCVHIEDDDDDSDNDDDEDNNVVVDDYDAACVNRSIAFYRAMSSLWNVSS